MFAEPFARPLLPYPAGPGPLLYDIGLDVTLRPEGGEQSVISRTNACELYYSAAQQLAHHASCGWPMRVGDLLGSGTISGPRGCKGIAPGAELGRQGTPAA